MPGPWEALYDRELSIAIKVRGNAPLKQVSLYFRQRLIRRYYPGTREFETTVRYWSCESGSFWLRAEDDAGGTAWCRAVPAHLVSFHHFIGGDRMNGYWYPTELAEPGPGTTKVSGRWCKILGSLYPGWGWGDRVAMYGPSQQDHPLGLETGPPDGGVREIRIAPRIQTTAGEKQLRSAPVRKVVLNSSDCVVLQDRIRYLVETVTDENGRNRRRVIRDDRIERAEAHLVGFRWREAIMLLAEGVVRPSREPELATTDRPNPSLLEVRAGDTMDAYEYVRLVYRDGEEIQTDAPSLPVRRGDKPGYVTLSAHPFGTPAVFFPAGTAVAVAEAHGSPAIYLGPDIGPAGTRLTDAAEGSYVFVLTSGPDHEAVLSEMADKLGFDGSPAWTVTALRGQALTPKQPVPVSLVTDAGGVVAEFGAARLPGPLPVLVLGLHGALDAAIVDLQEKRMVRHCAIWEQTAFLTLDLSRRRRVFIGHPVSPDPGTQVHVTVCSMSTEGGEIIVHNPEPTRRTVRLRTEPGLAELLTWEQTVTLDPGETLEFAIVP